MININCFNVEKRNVDKDLYIDILIYYIGYESLDGVRPLHASNEIHSETYTWHDNNIQSLHFHTNFSKINGYIEDNNNKGIKYPILTSVDENKS